MFTENIAPLLHLLLNFGSKEITNFPLKSGRNAWEPSTDKRLANLLFVTNGIVNFSDLLLNEIDQKIQPLLNFLVFLTKTRKICLLKKTSPNDTTWYPNTALLFDRVSYQEAQQQHKVIFRQNGSKDDS